MMSESKKPQSVMRYASLATQWMVMLLIAVWAGHKLDGITKWEIPVFIILFPLAALAVSFWQLIKEFSKPKK